jgi:MFS family permease
VASKIRDRNIWLINATILLVGVACGMAISLLAIHLHDRGYTEERIGSLAAWFALGIVGFSFPMSALIEKLTAKRALVGSLFLYAATVASFPFVTHSFALAALVRVFDGAASAGMWIGCETILLQRADKDEKAAITAMYAAAIAVGYMVGPFLSRLVVAGFHSLEVAFVVAGVISALTGLLVLVRLDPDKGTVRHEEDGEAGAAGAPSATTAAVVWSIKNSCFGNFAYGYFQSSVVLFLPLYLVAAKGITSDQTIIIPGFFAFGMLTFVRVAGAFGDRHGHLFTMRILGAIGLVTVLGFVVLDNFWAMCAAVAVAGATLASISPISLALQGVILAPSDYGRGNAIYNGFYATGMLLGPPISGRLFHTFGGPTMLYHLAALWAAFVVFSLVFAKDDPAYGKRAAVAPVA